MDITWFGHSCFRMKGKEAVVVTDPCDSGLGYSLNKLTANIVTISHQHSGHNSLSAVGNKPRVISTPGEYEVAGVFVIGIGTFHDAEQGISKGKNTIYLIEIDEMRVCHLGDLGHVLSPQQAEELGNVEVLLLPVGGLSTIDAKAALETVRTLNPNIVIPMHYHTDLTPHLDPIDRFLNEMGMKEINRQNRLTVSRSSLPSEPQVVLMDYPRPTE